MRSLTNASVAGMVAVLKATSVLDHIETLGKDAPGVESALLKALQVSIDAFHLATRGTDGVVPDPQRPCYVCAAADRDDQRKHGTLPTQVRIVQCLVRHQMWFAPWQVARDAVL